jgi:chromosome segregation ATPase
MNMPVFKEGSDVPGKAMVALVSIVLTGIVSVGVASYNSQGTTLASQEQARENSIENLVRADELTIAALKISVGNLSDAQQRTESQLSSIEQTQTNMSEKLTILQDANNAQTAVSTNIRDQFIDLRKQITENNTDLRNKVDAIDSWLRPLAPRSNGH